MGALTSYPFSSAEVTSGAFLRLEQIICASVRSGSQTLVQTRPLDRDGLRWLPAAGRFGW